MKALLLAAAACCVPAANATELVVYSERKEHLIKPLFERYTEQTGVRVRYLTDNAGVLIERLAAEGESTRADLLLTVDAGNLWLAEQRGVLQAVESSILEENVPAHLRDPDNEWFGLSVRARTIVYSTERVDPAALGGYADLADAQWAGRLCLRTSKKVYNQSLVAMLIARDGEAQTEQTVAGWVENLAAPPFSNDTSLIKAIAAGQCDVGVVNTYYLGRLLNDDPDLPVGLHWPARTHVNISGGGVTRHSQQPAAATALLEWLSGVEAQNLFAGLNMEYPVNAAAAPAPLVQAWGPYTADDTNLEQAGAGQAAAVRLMDRAGYE